MIETDAATVAASVAVSVVVVAVAATVLLACFLLLLSAHTEHGDAGLNIW